MSGVRDWSGTDMGSDRYCFASRGGMLQLPVETARQEFVRASMGLWLVSDLASGRSVSGVAEGLCCMVPREYTDT